MLAICTCSGSYCTLGTTGVVQSPGDSWVGEVLVNFATGLPVAQVPTSPSVGRPDMQHRCVASVRPAI